MIDKVRVRKVGDSLTVTVTKPIAEAAQISEGDTLMLETTTDGKIIIRKESTSMQSMSRTELEIAFLEKKKARIEAEITLAVSEHNNSMPTAHPGIDDDLIMEGSVKEWQWEIAKTEEEIAKKRLELA